MVSRWTCLMACLTMVGLGAIATAQDPTDMLTLPCRVVQADGEPLANAELSVSLLIGQPTGQQTSTTKTVTTDEDGRFEMTSARAGSWRVAISAEAAGWAIAPPAEVKPGIDPELVTAQLQPGGDVLGWVRVRGEDEPIAGASVSCTVFGAESGLRSKSTTDEDGTFIFSGVVPGEVSVYASADGFVSSRAAAQVALDEEPVEIVVELTRALTLQGTVVGPDGATPLVGATVRWSGSREEKTDGEGRFLLMNVRPRNVRMTVLAEGYAPVARTVEVTEGVEPDDVRIVVEHVGGIVSGQVTDSAAGAPAPDQLVLIVPGGTFQSGPRLEGVDAAEAERELGGNAWSPYYGSEWSYATRTDAEGRYRVEHVPPGMCEVAMIHAVRPNMGRRDVEVRDGESAEVNFESRLRPPGYITGRILDEDGAPIALPRGRRKLKGAGGSSSGELTVGEDGRYYVRVSRAGAHQFTVTAEGYGPTTVDVDVDLTGQAADVDFVLRPVEETQEAAGSLSGHVYLSDGETPAIGVSVSVFTTDAPLPDANTRRSSGDFSWRMKTNLATTGVDGAFTVVGLAPGTYGIYATAGGRHSGRQLPLAPNLANALPGVSEMVRVAADEETSGLRVMLALGGTVTGTVRDAGTGEPLAGVRVWSGQVDPDQGVYGGDSVSADNRGRFRLTRLAPGVYNLMILAKGHVSVSVPSVESKPGEETKLAIEMEPVE